jgi:hypothetical protein
MFGTSFHQRGVISTGGFERRAIGGPLAAVIADALSAATPILRWSAPSKQSTHDTAVLIMAKTLMKVGG